MAKRLLAATSMLQPQIPILGALLFCVGLVSACNSSPATAPADTATTPLKAADAACELPAGYFGHDLEELVGTRLGVPYDRLNVNAAGELLWNSAKVKPEVLEDHLRAASARENAVLLVIRPVADASCAAVQKTLAAAVRVGQCRPERCVLEWPNAGLPPPSEPIDPLFANVRIMGAGSAPAPDGIATGHFLREGDCLLFAVDGGKRYNPVIAGEACIGRTRNGMLAVFMQGRAIELGQDIRVGGGGSSDVVELMTDAQRNCSGSIFVMGDVLDGGNT